MAFVGLNHEPLRKKFKTFLLQSWTQVKGELQRERERERNVSVEKSIKFDSFFFYF